MFHECRLLDDELNGFNRIAVKELCVIIVTKDVSINPLIVTHCAGSPKVDARCLGHFVQPLNIVWDKVKLLMVAIIGFLKSLLIAPLLELCLTHKCTN